MTIEQILALIVDDKRAEVKKVLEALGTMTADKVNEFLKTDDGAKLLQPGKSPALDSAISKAVSAHDKKFNEDKLPDLLKEAVEKEIKVRYPDQTPQDKEIAELKSTIAKEKSDRLKVEQRARAQKMLQDIGLPIELAERYHGMKDDETDANIKGASEFVIKWRDDAVKAKDDEWLKRAGGAPGSGNQQQGKTMKREEFSALDPIAQREALKTATIID